MLPTEIAMSELTDTELDAVCGGLLNFNFASPVIQTNAATQIAWGLGYIADRYGSPCGAWSQSESAGWY